MEKSALLLIPHSYTLHSSIERGLARLGYSVKLFDYRASINNKVQKVNTQIFRFPNSIRAKWEQWYLKQINNDHKEVFDTYNPQIVIIYNSEMLLPETVRYFREKGSKVIFFLGDSPYFTPQNKYYLSLLFQADLIVSPDSFWIQQLSLLGIKNIIHEFPGFNDQYLNGREPTFEEKENYSCDLLFVGAGYADVWGYKRALFLSQFVDFDLKIYGNNKWHRWLAFFPELKENFTEPKTRITDETLQIMSKCAKLYPVDANPALLNGLHLRVFDAIAMGVLPLVEYRKDLVHFFPKNLLPIIENYKDSSHLAKTYIANDTLRESRLKELQNFCIEMFRSDISLSRILNKLS